MFFRTNASKFPCCFFRSKKIASSFTLVDLLVIRAELKILGILSLNEVDPAGLSEGRLIVSVVLRVGGTRALNLWVPFFPFLEPDGGVPPPNLNLFRDELIAGVIVDQILLC